MCQGGRADVARRGVQVDRAVEVLPGGRGGRGSHDVQRRLLREHHQLQGA